MKKWLGLLLALSLLLLCAAAFAEEPAADTEKEAVGMFDSAWASGYAELKAYYMDGYWKIEIAYGGFLWDYICVYDPELKALTADTNEENTKTSIAYDEEGSETGRTVEYTDGDAVFTLNEEGYLLWEDKKEDAGAGFEFEKIGWYPGEYACGEYTMSIYWDCEEPPEGGRHRFCVLDVYGILFAGRRHPARTDRHQGRPGTAGRTVPDRLRRRSG